MAAAKLGTVLRYIHTLAHGQSKCNSADGELLRQFTLHRDQAAFAALVRRHGRLVWGVCRHVLRHDQDAEDAFQATFLVLALKAGSIRKQGTVASWLHGVAYRCAMQIKRKAARRRAHEDRAKQDRSANSSSAEALRDLQELLDLEVQRLPDKYRAPFVLCCLEGMSKAEAATQLGWKEGTVSGRLARARLQLQVRLAKQGVALSAALSVAALATTAATAAPRAELVMTTVQAMMAVVRQGTLSGVVSTEIVTTVRGVSRALAAAKIKVIIALLLMASAAAGVATVLLQPAGAVQQAVAKQEALEAPGQEADQVIAEPQTSARTDLYGDPLPPGAIARMGTVRLRQRNSSAYLSAAVSPDRKFIATSGDDSIRLWNASTGKLTWRIKRTGQVGPLLFSPDGKWLAAPSGAGGVCLLDPATGRLERRLPDAAYCLTFSPDSRFLVTQGKKGTVIVRDTATGKQTHCLECGAGGQDEGATAAYTPDGETLVTLSRERRLCRWNLATGKLQKSVTLRLPQWRTLGLSPDARTLAVVPYSKEAVQLWDTESGTERLKLQGEISCSLYGLAFTPDSKTLATNWTTKDTGKDLLSIWETGTGKLLRRFELPGRALADLRFMADGRTLLSAPGGPAVRLWDTITGQELLQRPTHEGHTTSLCFTPDGRSLLSGGDWTVKVWNTADGRFLRTLNERYTSGYNTVAVWPDGKTMLSPCEDGALQLCDIASGKELERLPVEDNYTISPEHAFNVHWLVQNGQSIIAYSERRDSPQQRRPYAFFHIWDIATKKRVLRRAAEEDRILALSPDARIYASYIDGSTGPRLPVKTGAPAKKSNTVPHTGPAQVVLKEIATGRRLLTLPQPDQYGHQQAFSPDGRTLVTATYRIRYEENEYVHDRHTLHFWELATGMERLRIAAPETGRESCFASLMFSPDGRMLASVRGMHTSRMIQFWDVATGKELLQRTGYDAPVYISLAFSPDSKTLASAHGDGTILLWDISEARQALKRVPVMANKTLAEEWWAELKDVDAMKAYSAAWKLIAAPEAAVPALRNHLVPATSIPPDRLRQLLDDLDSNQFALRKAASQELAVLEELAIPALRDALRSNPSAEKRQRIEAVLGLPRIVRSREILQSVRAVEVLEQIATPEAKEVLATLVRGAPEARLTQEAKASVERLKRGASLVR